MSRVRREEKFTSRLVETILKSILSVVILAGTCIQMRPRSPNICGLDIVGILYCGCSIIGIRFFFFFEPWYEGGHELVHGTH